MTGERERDCVSTSGVDEAVRGRQKKLTLLLVVGLAGVEETVVDNVAGKDGKGLVGEHVVDGLVHAVLEGDGGIAVVVTVGARGTLGLARLVIFGKGSAAGGLLALGAGAGDVQRINVDVGVVDDLERLLAADGGGLVVASLFRGNRDSPGRHVGILADTEKGDAELGRGRGVDVDGAEELGDDGGLTGYSAVAELGVVGLCDNRVSKSYVHYKKKKKMQLAVPMAQSWVPRPVRALSSVLTKPLRRLRMLCAIG